MKFFCITLSVPSKIITASKHGLKIWNKLQTSALHDNTIAFYTTVHIRVVLMREGNVQLLVLID